MQNPLVIYYLVTTLHQGHFRGQVMSRVMVHAYIRGCLSSLGLNGNADAVFVEPLA